MKTFLSLFAVTVAAYGAPECSTTLSGIRLTSQNVLFVGDENRTSLNKESYQKFLKKFAGMDKASIVAFLRWATEYRIVDLEEIIAALDAFVPSENSLFSTLQGFSRLRFNEIYFTEDFMKPHLLVDFESRLALGKLGYLSTPNELLLGFAKRLHELSLASLGSSRILLAKPRFFVEEVRRLDAFLESMILKMGAPRTTLDRIFQRSWSARPVLREILLGLGFIWSHPVAVYQPFEKNLPLSIEEPESYNRKLFIQFGPLATYHWLRVHMMWAAFASFVAVIPTQIQDIQLHITSFNKVWQVLESGEGEKIFSDNYRRNLESIYRNQISEWETELQLEQAKLQSDPKNSETAEKIKNLREQIDYYREKLKH